MHENRRHAYGEFDHMLKEFDRFFDTIASNTRLSVPNHHVWCPPTDIYETDTLTVVRIEIAGMHTEDFQIALDDRTLTVSGTRSDLSDKVAYQRLEIAYGEFMTQVQLSRAIAADEIEAKYDRGFLYVLLPKRRLQQTRIPVQAVDSE